MNQVKPCICLLLTLLQPVVSQAEAKDAVQVQEKYGFAPIGGD